METTTDEARTAISAGGTPETQPAGIPEWASKVERLSIADGLYFLVVLAAAVMRFTGLGQIPLSPIEAQEALSAWQFLQAGRNIVDVGSPAYFTLTSLLMPFWGTSDVTARLVPALFGLGIVALPWFLRYRIGRVGALVTAALFAVSPLNAAVSRTVGGDAIALFAILLSAIAGMNLIIGRGQRWLYILVIAVSLGLTSSPLIYSGLITLLIAWWSQGKISQEPARIVWPEQKDIVKAILLGTILLIALSTRFFTYLAGIGVTAQLFGDWLAQFSWQGDIQTLLSPFLVLARYEVVLLPLGIFAIMWAIWRNQPLGILFTFWLLAALILMLLQQGVLINTLLASMAGYLLLGLATKHLLQQGGTRWSWAIAGTFIMLGAIILVNMARFLRVSFTEQQIANLWIVLLALAAIVLAIYYFWTVHEKAILQGTWLSLLLLLLLYQWGTSWHLTHVAANDPRERWVEQATDDDVAILLRSLQDISRRNTNSDSDLPLFSAVDSPVLRWYLRDFWRAQIGQTIPQGAQYEVIISNSNITEPTFGSDYLGSDFGLLRAGTAPAALSSTPVLDTLRWWLFHESLSSVIEERVILWVRADLAYSQ